MSHMFSVGYARRQAAAVLLGLALFAETMPHACAGDSPSHPLPILERLLESGGTHTGRKMGLLGPGPECVLTVQRTQSAWADSGAIAYRIDIRWSSAEYDHTYFVIDAATGRTSNATKLTARNGDIDEPAKSTLKVTMDAESQLLVVRVHRVGPRTGDPLFGHRFRFDLRTKRQVKFDELHAR